ncbi:acetylxylan esterase [Bryobacter aggregatus]|uniref:alpha/beta hydrolase family protein n=1 Tax=Bryobacter aggregatus TaxID=360054 RepID=UPI0009B5ADF2|nr:acetylxylan esterase [Bryobacter aggregatus]
MFLIALVFLCLFPLSAQSTEDSRNVEVPHPNYRFEFQAPPTLGEWKTRRDLLRRQILNAAGIYPGPARGKLNVEITRRRETQDYRIWTLLLETFPGYFVGAEMYLPPATMRGPFPVVLSPHGHWKQGRLTHREDYSVPSLGVNLAAQGYIVLAWDMVGYGDARQLPHDFISKSRQLWGFSPMGLQLWNSIRMVDYAESLAEADRKRIAVTGASGGGTQTFLLTAVDDRIRVSVPVNMISSSMQGGDPCEEAPGLRRGTNNVEFAAMAAPRPMLMVSASGDWTKNTPKDEYPRVQSVYALYEQQEHLANAHFEAGHNYNKASREAVYAFLAKHLHPLAPAGEQISFESVLERHKEDLLEMPRQTLPERALDEAAIDLGWKSFVEKQNRSIGDRRFLRERLRLTLGVSAAGLVEGNTSGKVTRITRLKRDEIVQALRSPGERGTVVVIHPESAQRGLDSKEAERWRKAGYSVLALEPFHESKTRESYRRADKWFSSYNVSDLAIHVEDILIALQFVRGEGGTRTHLTGIGDAAVWCTFAAALNPWPVELEAKLEKFKGSDGDFLGEFFAPGMQRAGGLGVAGRLLR